VKSSEFFKPSRDDLSRLVKSESRQDIYTSSLGLIQDILCEFSASREGPRFLDDDFRLQRLSEIASPIGGVSALVPGDPIQNNIVENLGIALDIQKRARAYRGGRGRKALLDEVEQFLDALEDTYRDILILMHGGSKASRVKRA
jgi:hypothetical protein